MHELSVVLEVVKIVEQRFAAENGAGKIESLTLRIGELSSVIPGYAEAVYPAAVRGTILEDAELKIEIVPAEAKCADCGEIFSVREHRAVCPSCSGKDLRLLSGREFHIKEIAVIS